MIRGAKIYEKSIKNQCKIEARKSDATMMENGTKMEPKWEPKSIQNHKKLEDWKKGIQKSMPKNDAEKGCPKSS